MVWGEGGQGGREGDDDVGRASDGDRMCGFSFGHRNNMVGVSVEEVRRGREPVWKRR